MRFFPLKTSTLLTLSILLRTCLASNSAWAKVRVATKLRLSCSLNFLGTSPNGCKSFIVRVTQLKYLEEREPFIFILAISGSRMTKKFVNKPLNSGMKKKLARGCKMSPDFSSLKHSLLFQRKNFLREISIRVFEDVFTRTLKHIFISR